MPGLHRVNLHVVTSCPFSARASTMPGLQDWVNPRLQQQAAAVVGASTMPGLQYPGNLIPDVWSGKIQVLQRCPAAKTG